MRRLGVVTRRITSVGRRAGAELLPSREKGAAIRFGLRVPPCLPLQEVAATVQQAEAEGFDYAWVPDSQLLWRDVWVTLGVAGARTSRIVLGTNVTNPRTRDATVTASSGRVPSAGRP